MRQLTAAVAVAAAGIFIAGCGDGSAGDTASSSTTTSNTASSKVLEKSALPGVMLSPDDLDSLLGVRGTTSDPPFTSLGEDSVHRTDYTFPPECKYTIHAGLASEYADSGSSAAYGYHDLAPTPTGAKQLESPDVYQFVVLFPSPEQASAFVTASSQRWPACANRQDTVPADGTHPELQWKVGSVSNADGVLSTLVTLTINGTDGSVTIPCQRALTARKNVVIDVNACRKDIGDFGISIAKQIAGKVDKQ